MHTHKCLGYCFIVDKFANEVPDVNQLVHFIQKGCITLHLSIHYTHTCISTVHAYVHTPCTHTHTHNTHTTHTQHNTHTHTHTHSMQYLMPSCTKYMYNILVCLDRKCLHTGLKIHHIRELYMLHERNDRH